MPSVVEDSPEVGQLVRARGQQWVVAAVDRSHQPTDELSATRLPGRTMVTLTSVADDDLGEELRLVWEVEPGREIVPATALPEVSTDAWDDPQRLGAFVDAVRWGTVASADTRTLQAPFRSGITIEEYQLEPVARALRMPRVNLLIADDVGLGKTIEAGLVVQELLLRHRARRVVVVCPASLTVKWRDEMAEKFGLDFVVLDATALRDLRRSHGMEANAFEVHPRTIISLQWLRTPRVQRLLDEVLTPDTRSRGFVDLLIVDEAHHVAPPAPRRGRGYAVDSLQTRAVRRLSDHSTHRLLLSATPHNGYSESWQALLEMVDPQRFTRGVEPDPAALAEVKVRRMKQDLVRADGSPVFASRLPPRAIEVSYTDDERHAHELLARYLHRRRTQAGGGAAVRADDLVTLLLKKRLFSSPPAFARTLAAHVDARHRAMRAADNEAAQAGDDALPGWLVEAMDWDDALVDDTDASQAERDLLDRAAEHTDASHSGDHDADALLEQLQEWAERFAEPADSKAHALIAELELICRPEGRTWTDERVIVFTEYVDTQTWLAGLLEARGLGGERLGLLFGGMDQQRRERLKAAFQAAPDRDSVRILLATDSASEGIDLQRHCHRVIQYDIPFNPNRLEQRIGRVDRHGQEHPVEVAHFVGAGWQDAPAGSFTADLEFLSRVARKVATEREDLGSINPVLAAGVEARMLGRPFLDDPLAVTPKPSTAALAAERELREQVQRLRAQLDDSVQRLHVAPANVRRVVDTALALAGQPPLTDAAEGQVAPPDLRAGWERTVEDLRDPLDPEIRRPMSFDADLAADRDDVVYAHLEHPLVAQSTRLLRSAVWGGRETLHRVTAVKATLPEEIDGLLAAVFSRLVVVGVDGTRLHEEVMLAGRVVPASGRSRRLELEQPRLAGVRDAVEAAFEPDACRPAGRAARDRAVEVWQAVGPLVAADVEARAAERLDSLARLLERRQAEEAKRIGGTFAQLEATLRSALAGGGPVQLRLDELDAAERGQLDRDRRAWQERLDNLDAERDHELDAVAARYASPKELVFPFAVAVCERTPQGLT